MVQAVRPGNRRNPGRRPVAETTRSLDDRTGPGPDQPPDPDPYPGPEAQDPADRDIAPGRARGGDDRRAQFRAAVPRAGAAPGAAARPPARARAGGPPGAVALHRDRGRLTSRARRPGGLDVGAGAGVAVTALVLPARTAGARVVAADLGEVVAHTRAGAGLHVRAAVHGRSGVLQPLRAARGERGRDRRVLTLAAGNVLAACRGTGPPGVGTATAGPALTPAGLPLGAAGAAISPAALSAAAVTGPGWGVAAGVRPGGATLRGHSALRGLSALRGRSALRGYSASGRLAAAGLAVTGGLGRRGRAVAGGAATGSTADRGNGSGSGAAGQHGPGSPVLLHDRVLLDLDLEVEQQPDGLFLDPLHHGAEHVVALALILDQRVALAVAAQADALAQVVHLVQVLAPLAVQDGQDHPPLDLAHDFRTKLLLTPLVRGLRVGDHGLGDELAGEPGPVTARLVDDVVDGQADRVQLPERPPQLVQVPLFRVTLAGLARDVPGRHLVDHLADLLVQVGTLQHLAALAVDDLPLPVQHVVVLQDVLADLEVLLLDLGLGGPDSAGDDLG